MDIEGVHKCDDSCHCPVHQLMMYYHSRSRSHACQNPDCEYASGYEDRLIQEIRDRRFRAIASEIIKQQGLTGGGI